MGCATRTSQANGVDDRDHHDEQVNQETAAPNHRPRRERHTPRPFDTLDFEPALSTPVNKGTSSKPPKMQLERKVKLVTEQRNIDKPSPVAEFPMKEWNVKIYLLDQNGEERPANCFTKVTYNLHPSFENPNQTFFEPPFTCTNEGWGEFEMSIDMFTTEKGGKSTVFHDLNFQSPSYDNIQTVTFKNPNQTLLQLLRETGPISDEDPKAAKVRKANDGKKRKAAYDYERMADALTKLEEDALLHVIQMIHDHKTEETYTKNDMDQGEFSVDLYTLPDNLARMIWDFLVEQKMVS